MSHELKTPLNQIINNQLELFDKIYELSESAKAKLNKSISMSQYLLSLIRDMIDYSYIKNNNIEITKNQFNITNMVNECIQIVKNFYDNSSVLLENKISESLKVVADKAKIRQILLSLITSSLG